MNHPQTLDFIAEMALIDISRIERNVRMYSHSTRRKASDAALALRQAGYVVRLDSMFITYRFNATGDEHVLPIASGTVDNDTVLELLDRKQPSYVEQMTEQDGSDELRASVY